jgi:two-component system alkaline phosphatase synthesis response regulator PhoP
MMDRKVLIIEDEPDFVELVRYNLEAEGFTVIDARNGEAGLALARQQMPDLIVLDLLLPGFDGLEVCRRLRADPATKQIRVIMLTAKASETDRIVGLEIGADDYVTKPFSPRELVARVKAHLRRAGEPPEPSEGILRNGLLTIDEERHEVMYEGKVIPLTAAEFRILRMLARSAGRVFSRNEIIDETMGSQVAVTDRTIDVHMASIRKKLGPGGNRIETVRGFGYKWQDGSSAS